KERLVSSDSVGPDNDFVSDSPKNHTTRTHAVTHKPPVPSVSEVGPHPTYVTQNQSPSNPFDEGLLNLTPVTAQSSTNPFSTTTQNVSDSEVSTPPVTINSLPAPVRAQKTHRLTQHNSLLPESSHDHTNHHQNTFRSESILYGN